jgi:hypothetical protein
MAVVAARIPRRGNAATWIGKLVSFTVIKPFWGACLLAGVLAGGVASPVSAQPLSQSMAQCAGLHVWMSERVSAPERQQKLKQMATIWRGEALRQAQAEGQGKPAEFVAGHLFAMLETWRGKSDFAVLNEEFRDWVNYCGSLGRSRGISFE